MSDTIATVPGTIAAPISEPQGGSIVTALQESELYRGYRRAFERTVGLPLDLKRPDSFHFPLDGSTHQNRFCTLLARRNRSCAACLQFQQRLHENGTETATTMECGAGLKESAIPVRVGDSLVGYLRTGQVFSASPSRARLQEFLRQIGVMDHTPEGDELAAAYHATPVMKEARYEAVVSLLRVFAHHLGTLANRLVVEHYHAEQPFIAKARAYMERNLGEQIRLEDAAHAVNMSTFYFCKLFRRATGVTFTRYLARIRVEVVKQKLLDPNTRVCEAAYATGFQSLSQFNRVFRWVAGETPSAYRRRLQSEGARSGPWHNS